MQIILTFLLISFQYGCISGNSNNDNDVINNLCQDQLDALAAVDSMGRWLGNRPIMPYDSAISYYQEFLSRYSAHKPKFNANYFGVTYLYHDFRNDSIIWREDILLFDCP